MAFFADAGRTWQRLLPTYRGVFRQLVHGPLPAPAAVADTLAAIGRRLRALA